jgi:hypothetical protein
MTLCSQTTPVTVAARSWAWTIFARSSTGIVGSNPTRGMDVCVRLFCVCVGSGLATGWSPFQGVLPTVLGLINWSEAKRFTDVLCSKAGATGKERESRMNINLLNVSFLLDSHFEPEDGGDIFSEMLVHFHRNNGVRSLNMSRFFSGFMCWGIEKSGDFLWPWQRTFGFHKMTSENN